MVASVITGSAAIALSAYRQIEPYASAAGSASGRPAIAGDPNAQTAAHPLLGGISLDYARELASDFRDRQLSQRGVFHLSISTEPDYKGGSVDIPKTFFLFATAVSYNAVDLASDRKNVGGARVDGVTGDEPTEMRITTMDDRQGTLKRWFHDLAAKVSNRDGTVGLPASYCVRIAVRHGYAFESVDGAGSAYQDAYLMRPASVEYDLDRSARSELQMIQFVFTEFDTFMPFTRG